MIDIVFQLLIFFLVATKFKTTEGVMEAYLPRDQGQRSAPAMVDLNTVRVSLDSVGESGWKLRLGLRVLDSGDDPQARDLERRPGWAQLTQNLREMQEKSPEPLPVILDVDPEVAHVLAVCVLDAVVEAGLSEVSFALPERPAVH